MEEAKTRKFVECGCCGELHPQNFHGDCRDDKNRFHLLQVIDELGWDGFEIVDEEEEIT